MRLLPQADPHERAHPRPDRGTTFFVLPDGAILETGGDLSQSEAAARWDAEEAARRERYERDRAAWITPPPERDSDLDRRRTSERSAWLEKHNAKWDAREASERERRLLERDEWTKKRAAKTTTKRKALRRAGRSTAWIERQKAKLLAKEAERRAAIAAEKAAWLARHNARWDARLAAIRTARETERTAWLERHKAKWAAREAEQRAHVTKARSAWLAQHAEPPIPSEDTDPDVARDQWLKRHAWEKRRDRLLAPFRPRPFQAVIALADAVPAVELCAVDCAIPEPHVHTVIRKKRAAKTNHSHAANRKQSELPMMRWRWPIKNRAIKMGRSLTRREKREVVELAPWRKLHVLRPKTRGECADGPRPCPWVTCRMHLFTDVSPKSGSLKINFPGRSIEYTLRAMKDTCALDVADRGGITLEEVGDLVNVSMERARQIQEPALGKTREQVDDDYMYEGGEEPEGDDDGTAW